MTSGVMLPLTTADLLAMTIVGSVLENMDMERLITGELSPGMARQKVTRQKSGTKSPRGSNKRENRCRVSKRSLSKLLWPRAFGKS